MPLESLLIRMKDAGYTGPFSLTIDPIELGAGDDARVIERLQEARKFLEKYY